MTLKLNFIHMKKVLLLTFVIFAYLISYAQEVTVKGVVTSSETGNPIPGVNVLIKGTTNGTITNVDGAYTLNANMGETLVFSFIGMIPQDIVISSETINVKLSEEVSDIDEVIVVGYGQTQNKRTTSTALTKISANKIESLPISRPEQTLQGTAPGVIVQQQSGSPGAPVSVRIRGIGSANQSAPLYIVDGMQVPDLRFLNASDIADISILKDAASSAIYGARGGNGVVLVQTKTGKRKLGGPKVTVSGYHGVQSLLKKPEVMDRDQYIDYFNNAVDYHNTYLINAGNNNNLPGGNGFRGKITEAESASLPDTDWYDELFDSAPTSNLHFGLMDGGEDFSWSLSGGYFTQDGMAGGDTNDANFVRRSLRGSFEKDVVKGLNFFVNGSFAQADRNFLFENAADTQAPNIANFASSLAPIFPTHQDGEIFNPGKVGSVVVNDVTLFGVGAITNPLLILESVDQNELRNTLAINTGLKYEISDIKLTSSLDYYQYNQTNKLFSPTYNYPTQGFQNSINVFQETVDKFKRYQWTNTASYKMKNLDAHSLEFLGGMSIQEDEYISEERIGTDFYVNTIDEVNFGLIKDPSRAIVRPTSIDETGWVSFFARANYSYKQKYIFSATFRADASSKFSEDNRTGYFPSFSAGWNLSEEPIFQGSDIFDLLKIRASWGKNGSDRIDNYQYALQTNSSTRYLYGGQTQAPGIAPSTMANPDIKWETVTQTNIGLDANLFKSKLGITFDYYIKKTTDMLASVGTPDAVGLFAPAKNVADVENKGIELLLTHKNRISPDFKYEISFNFNKFNNEVTKLGEGQPFTSGAVAPSWPAISRTDVGEPIASFYGRVVEGLDDEGNLVFKTDGDGNIVREYIGNPYPDFIYGINGSMEFKGFDFGFFIYGNQGNDIYKAWVRPDGNYFNVPESYANAWTADNQNTSIARPTLFGFGGSGVNYVSDYYVEDGSFIKLKNITLGYTLPKKISNAIHASKIRFYVSAQNLFVITDYTGGDPEIGQATGDSYLDVGIDRGFYPQPKVFLGGFQIDLF